MYIGTTADPFITATRGHVCMYSMFQNVQIFSFDGSPPSCNYTDLFIFHVVLARIAVTKTICLVSVVMIRKTGKESQFWSKTDRVVQTHLKKHVHLTNCIHLKHHVHMQKRRMVVDVQHPSELAFIRELAVLQRARSLRDPSTSPSCKSPSAGSFTRKFNLKEAGRDDRWEQTAIGHELKKTPRWIAPALANSIGERARKGDLAICRAPGDGFVGGKDLSEGEDWVEIRPGDGQREATGGRISSTSRAWVREGAKYSSTQHVSRMTTDSFRLRLPAKRTPEFKEEIDSSRVIRHGKRQQETSSSYRLSRNAKKGLVAGHEKQRKELNSSMDDTGSLDSDKSTYCSESHTQSKLPGGGDVRSRKLKKNRNSRLLPLSGGNAKDREGLDSGVPSTSRKRRGRKASLASNEGSATSGGNEDLEITELSQNGCGIPWNWSRIHNRGKNFLDLAGRGLSCGASEQGTGRVRTAILRSYTSSCGESMAATGSEISVSSFNSDSESLPLLLETGSPLGGGSASEPNVRSGRHMHEISRHGGTSRFSPEAWLSVNEDRQLSLSQKYMPKAFNEIVGQKLVTQALSNALIRGKIASVYIFHGPRGTGKTSCAKVFAAALNCLSSEEQRPCGSCSECLAHSFGKTSIVKEVSAAGKHSIKVIKALIHDVNWSSSPRFSSSRYKVFIVDECHSLSVQAWNIFFKILEEAPRNIVFILSTTNLELLPHAVASRCQKFLFTKLKESVIVNRLQAISVLENLDVDLEALKLIASMADGSVRDGEMMLDQLSLLGQKISLPMVQELVGLISDDKLVDLLDVALSADTVNTVRRLRDLMESGVEPLALTSQLATLITSILGGGYNLPKERHKRKFLRKDNLSKEEMERLRQALKTLSEAEKQLRGSSDRTTWLIAALLQFAPDKSYLHPSSSADTSFTHSPVALNDVSEMADFSSSMQKQSRESDLLADPPPRHARLSELGDIDASEGSACKPSSILKIPLPESMERSSFHPPELRHDERDFKATTGSSQKSASTSHKGNHCEACLQQASSRVASELEDIWQRVLDVVHSNSLRQFLQTHGRLLSLATAKAFLVAHLEFSQPEHQSRAERSKRSIAHAFQVTLGSVVEVKVTLATHRDKQSRPAVLEDQPGSFRSGQKSAMVALEYRDDSDEVMDGNLLYAQEGVRLRGMHQMLPDSVNVHGIKPTNTAQTNNQGADLVVFECGGNLAKQNNSHTNEQVLESAWVQDVQASPHRSTGGTCRLDKRSDPRMFRSNSTGKGKVSLGFVIQQPEGSVDGRNQDIQFDHTSEASNRKRVRHRGPEFVSATREGSSATALKLEEENLRLESRSGGLLCWKTVKRGQGKVKQLRRCSRRPGLFSRLVPCAKSNRR